MSSIQSSVGLAPQVQLVLGVSGTQAQEIVDAFDNIGAKPLQRNLSRKKGRDLAKRNPMIYTVRGVATVSKWVEVVSPIWLSPWNRSRRKE